MEIPDLQLIPSEHPPSPYDFPVVIGVDAGEVVIGELPRAVTLRAVGWLGNTVVSTGDVPDEFVERLIDAYESNRTISDGTMGWHDCEICITEAERYPGGKAGPVVRWRGRELRLYGHGHHLVRLEKSVYMCPALILHYVLDHAYGPPHEFVSAVIRGTFLTTNDLVPSREVVEE